MFVDRNSHKRVFVRQVVAKSNHHGKDGESEAHINGRSRSIQTALPVYYIWTCTRIITQRRPAALAHTWFITVELVTPPHVTHLHCVGSFPSTWHRHHIDKNEPFKIFLPKVTGKWGEKK